MLAIYDENGLTEYGKKVVYIFTAVLLYICGIIGHMLFVFLFSRNKERDEKKVTKVVLWITSFIFIPGWPIMTIIVFAILERNGKAFLSWFPTINNPFVLNEKYYKDKIRKKEPTIKKQ
ncbi:hypothetical protein [Spiroplasma tabanidicola]|uniref:Uncharacterized protein n=1 Tax=Spiroplasma tabanidicola TaxID=324079 RepID=A0A6I6C7I6_9MOLU|nr:hypothetical protein [Spiroplasma tabanidicola]QGS51756.1 hypothetical protein STABA_v1c03930 [Spiroplasma tabanidicola]